MEIILLNNRVFITPFVMNTNVKYSFAYKSITNKLLLALRFVHLKTKFPLFSIWFTQDFKKKRKKGETIVIFDSQLTGIAANYLKRRNPDTRVIYWFWNHIYDTRIIKSLNLDIEKWSYDKADCHKYNLKFNTQFNFLEFTFLQSSDTEYDFFFVGKDKERGKAILELQKELTDLGYICNFIISDALSNTKRLSYKEVIDYDIKAKCIVDLTPEDQYFGLSLRPIEAIMLKKKYLTNNPNIVSEPFYDPNNIFIYGKDKTEKLRDFLDSPYNSHKIDFSKYYSFEEWTNRFENQ